MAERDEEWGPWVEHDGKGCPCVGKYVRSQTDDGVMREHIAHCHFEGVGSRYVDCWLWSDCYAKGKPKWRVIRFRIRKPRALRDLIKLAETVPSEMEDA